MLTLTFSCSSTLYESDNIPEMDEVVVVIDLVDSNEQQ